MYEVSITQNQAEIFALIIHKCLKFVFTISLPHRKPGQKDNQT